MQHIYVKYAHIFTEKMFLKILYLTTSIFIQVLIFYVKINKHIHYYANVFASLINREIGFILKNFLIIHFFRIYYQEILVLDIYYVEL